MAKRPTQQDRLGDIALAATRVFGKLGYKRTQMANVAAEAGLSAGAVYTYVESKEALFHVVFAYGFGELGTPPLPIAAPPFEETIRLIGRGLRKTSGSPRLQAALEEKAPTDIRAELTAIIEERYTSVADVWPLLAVIEKSAVDLPELEALYFQRGRRALFTQLTRYVEQRAASGHLRAVPDAAVAARFVVENVAWFAWHRRGDRDASLYDDAQVHATVVELLCNALIPSA